MSGQNLNLGKFITDQVANMLGHVRWTSTTSIPVNLEDRDINVAERANAPKFSKVDDIVTLLRLFKLFFDDVLIEITVAYPKLYSHREEPDISFETTA